MPIKIKHWRFRIKYTHVEPLLFLSAQISEMCDIPVEHLVLGEQLWSSALSSDSNLSAYVSNSDINWIWANDSENSDQSPNTLIEEGRIIYYR